MEQYIKNITPFVQQILDLTKKREIQWTKSGEDTYRCIAEYESVSLEISQFDNILVKGSVSIKLYSERECLFSYSRDLLQEFPEFDKLLEDLFAEVEKANVEKVTNKFSTLVNALTKNQK